MKFSATLLLLVPLALAGPAIESAQALPELHSVGEKGHNFPEGGEVMLAAAKVCPAKFPRKCSIGNFCCRTKKCCTKQCCQNSAKYCIKGLCYK
ncbi:hypothetical protein FZEAL_19 [Fusarium zealandicum]|uniref:Uncharacterized protein n=1 Tax=Fusarium zealandicum TaxID=1053134 RepID=A0A8H4UVN7_9HYPO|nr:hypothetical protein FZEAL_19 [Fusarium zealandicum]